MKKFSYSLILFGLIAILGSTEGYAQFKVGKNSLYQIMNLHFQRSENGWLQLEGAPTTFRDSKLVLGALNTSPSGKFRCFHIGPGYHIQLQFEDKTWGVLEIENSFKKEGAQVLFVKSDVKGENFIVHPQRFLIQEAKLGHFIRSMDGRYLRYNPSNGAVVLTAEQPAKYASNGMDETFMWGFSQPLW